MLKRTRGNNARLGRRLQSRSLDEVATLVVGTLDQGLFRIFAHLPGSARRCKSLVVQVAPRGLGQDVSGRFIVLARRRQSRASVAAPSEEIQSVTDEMSGYQNGSALSPSYRSAVPGTEGPMSDDGW